MQSDCHDIAIIGGGIVGLATAMALGQTTSVSLIVLEAEDHLAAHQSGHNSGVIHSGLYYRPGSLKATICAAGRDALYHFCAENGVAHERCGKLVVATVPEELAALDELERRGRANGLSGLRRLAGAELREFEPEVAGIAGLYVAETGIVDFRQVTEAYAQRVRATGGLVQTHTRLTKVVARGHELVLETTKGPVACHYLVNCAGLQADRVARLAGLEPGLIVVPFRGEYYELVAERRGLVRNLIYPVPDPRFPFLGVHFTRTIAGGVEAGPNAVLALARTGYRRGDVSARDIANMASFAGFWRMAGRYWKTGVGELYRSLSKRAFVRALQKLLPRLQTQDLQPAGSGVRAQALQPDGNLVDDFRFVESGRMIHVLNAPSPAATASIAIGQHIADMARRKFDLAGR
jgi:L-2-hydroxyglutarate oxidase